MSKDVVDRVMPIVDDYLNKGDHSNENANMMWSPNGLLFSVGTESLKVDYLERINRAGFGELAELHELGGVHIHDLSMGYTTPYCCGHSLFNLLQEGIKSGTITSKPAKHFRSAINHIVNYIGAAANEYAGAQAFSDIDLYLAPYAYKCFLDLLNDTDDINLAKTLAEKEVRQSIQELIFHLNYNTRYGGQPPFSNITLAITVPSDMKNKPAMIGGKLLNYWYDTNAEKYESYNKEERMFTVVAETDEDSLDYFILGQFKTNPTYGELQEWQSLVTEAIIDTFLQGDASGKGFTFPVLTINVTNEFFENPIRHKIYELAAKYGTPYFQNFINGVSGRQKINVEDVRSMCCRLQINEKLINKHVGGIFGNAEQTGSIQVVTLSLPYIAMEVKDKLGKYIENFDARCSIDDDLKNMLVDNFIIRLESIMNQIKEEQLWKRAIVEEFFEKGFFPMSKSNFKRGFDAFYTTIGFVGLWEAVQILTDSENSFLEDEGMELAKSILSFMADTIEGFINETHKLFNLEATPAESASYKLAKKAIKRFPDVPYRGVEKTPYFTNSCHIPVELQNRLDLIFMTQSELQTIPSGGTVTHFYTGEEMSPEEVETVVKVVCETPIPYFSVTTVYSVCPIHGYIPGAHEFCPYDHSEDDLKGIDSKYIVVDNSSATE